MSLRKRTLSLCLGIVMALGMLPLSAMAADSLPLTDEMVQDSLYNEKDAPVSPLSCISNELAKYFLAPGQSERPYSTTPVLFQDVAEPQYELYSVQEETVQFASESGTTTRDSMPLLIEVDTSQVSYHEGIYSGNLNIIVQNYSNVQIQAVLFLAFYTGDRKMIEIQYLPEMIFSPNSKQSIEFNDLSVHDLKADSYYKVFAIDTRNEYKPLSKSVEIPVNGTGQLLIYIDYEQSTEPWLDGETHQLMVLEEYMNLIGAVYNVDPSTSAIVFRRNNQYAAMAPGETQFLVQQSTDSVESYTLNNPPVIYAGNIYVPYDEVSKALGMKIVKSNINGGRVVNIFTSDVIKGSDQATVELNIATGNKKPVTGCVNNGIAYYSIGTPKLYMFNGNATASIDLTDIPESMCVDKSRLYYIAKGVIYCTDLDSQKTIPIYSTDTDLYMLNIYNGDIFFKMSANKTDLGTLCQYNPILGTEKNLGTIYGYDISNGMLYATTAVSRNSVSIQTIDLFTEEKNNYAFPVSLAQEMYALMWMRPYEIKISGNALYVRLYFSYAATSSTFRFSNEYMVCDLNTGNSQMVTYDTYDALRSDSYLHSTSKSTNVIDFRTQTKVNNSLGDTSVLYTNLLMVDRKTGETSVLIPGNASRGLVNGGYWNYLVYSYSYICGDGSINVFLRVAENYYVPTYSGQTIISACTVNQENGSLVILQSRTFDY